MCSEQQAVVKMAGLEVGLYRQGDQVTVYVNQGGVCIFRERVALVPELAGEIDGVSLETLRRISGAVRIGAH